MRLKQSDIADLIRERRRRRFAAKNGVKVAEPIYQKGYFLKTKSSGISARVSTTAGTGTAYLCYLSDDGTITETTKEVNVYNVFGTAIAGSTYITAKLVGNILVIDAEDC